MWAIGAFILILTPIIIVHELGHFWSARFFNIKVDEFGIGFPPRAATLFESKGTKFSINWIPLGGFVRPAGEDDPTVEGGLAGASKTARFFTLAMGAIFNFIFAIALFWIAFMMGPPALAVSEVMPDSPAEAAGLQAGDILWEVEGEEIAYFDILSSAIRDGAGQQITFLVGRDGEDVTIPITPRRPGEYNAETDGPTGIRLESVNSGGRFSFGPIRSLTESWNQMTNIIKLTVQAPAMLIRGTLSPSEARPVSIVGISQIAGQAAQSSASIGNWFQVLSTAGLISVALGFTNLLPIPALDGGRILFVLIEAIRGKRVSAEREGFVHMAGMIILLGLMVLLIVQDIVNPLQF